MKTIQEIIDGENYNFLRTDEHLRGKLIFLTLGDSHAYGTNIPSSDINVRGCAFNRKSDLIGLSSFEQVINEETNTTIYSFNELINLLCNCNPNVIEMLGCKPEHYLMLNPVGQELINNRKMFLSKKAVQSFGGDANQQLRQLQDALVYNSYPQSERERHIMGSVKSAMADFDNRYASIPEGSLSLEIGKSERPDLDNEIFVNVNLMHYPLMDYKNIWSDMHNIVKYHGKLNKRNSKKDDLHLNTLAMRLIRLYLMALDILENEEIITYREHDLPLLMDIQNGKYQKPDGTICPEFFDMVDEYKKRMEYAAANTSLPKNPNYMAIEDFQMEVDLKVVLDEY